MMEKAGNKDRWKGVKDEDRRGKAVDDEKDGPISIILTDFPNSVKPGL